ncbi:HNH endonuclease signature motif containing protein [Nocardioides pelophilus]|uniref:HNH endonuclease signature motif containing protein n=1 Tax=Nocardioides pelophilus TaxID=2172019 RepID=UPI001603D922|nr:HNH endonuclease signature motif containing protein [Nocardioides pelophilus]
MDLGTAPLFDLTAPAAVADELAVLSRSDELLAEIRGHRTVVAEREIATLRAIVEWAAEHVVADEADAATLTERGLDTGLPLAGPGAPLISDFAVMELSALLGRSLDSGRNYVGQVIELAHRLPRLWARVLDGEVPVWKALRVTDSTRLLPAEAAVFVDRHLAPYAHGCTWTQVDRLVEEALVRFDPEAAEERRRSAQDHRHVDTGLDAVGYDGIAHINGVLDVADALDLENAVARRAKLYGQLGDDDSLDVRRAKALGEIAREDLALDLEVADPDTGEVARTIAGRRTELVVHLSATDQTVGRFGNTRTPISVEQIKQWLGLAHTSVIVRPVIDLAGSQPVDSYEIPDRIARQVKLRDHHCVFPHCTRPAESCDLDHIEPHAAGGETSARNLAPKCRGHHRMKTAGRASYRMLTPGTYYWTLPSGTYLVDPTGTYDLTLRPPDH